jgi:lipid-binding SYLF domain-containing protein
MSKTTPLAALFTVAVMILMGCETVPKTEAERESLADQAGASIKQMKADDSSLDRFLQDGYGYAVFPSVGKGGLVAGGAYGRGVVYEQGRMIGFSSLSQATIGAQVGGQSYSELIVFESKDALDRFTSKEYALSANASAVALKSGAAAAARYSDGVAVFVKPTGGLMAEASIGGQRFTFERRSSEMHEGKSYSPGM